MNPARTLLMAFLAFALFALPAFGAKPTRPDYQAQIWGPLELDPEGGAGKDAKRVLEDKTQPQYGQRVVGATRQRQGGMSILTILGISLLTVALFAGPVANLLKITSPSIGIIAGLFVFLGLYSAFGRKK